MTHCAYTRLAYDLRNAGRLLKTGRLVLNHRRLPVQFLSHLP
jgi:hypothetical protein